MTSRKQAVSIRLASSDVRKVKFLASRLGVRESDVIRFALKSMLSRIGPLCDPEVAGSSLLPVFVEHGVELIRFFELDATQLEAIVNGDAGADGRVEHDDLELLSLTGLQHRYALLRLRRGSDATDDPDGSVDALRRYLYEKYIYGNGNDADDAVVRAVG